MSSTQLQRVRDLVNNQPSFTLAEVALATGSSEAAVSARLRDIRAMGYEVICTKVKGENQRRYRVNPAPSGVLDTPKRGGKDVSLAKLKEIAEKAIRDNCYIAMAGDYGGFKTPRFAVEAIALYMQGKTTA